MFHLDVQVLSIFQDKKVEMRECMRERERSVRNWCFHRHSHTGRSFFFILRYNPEKNAFLLRR